MFTIIILTGEMIQDLECGSLNFPTFVFAMVLSACIFCLGTKGGKIIVREFTESIVKKGEPEEEI